MNNNYLVRVQCMTYNHAPYIEDALNGFTMQQTNFPYICVIIDDASTDGEQEVIKKYLKEHFDLDNKNVARHEETDDYHLTFARHKTNRNCYFAVLYLKYNHYSIRKNRRPYIQEWMDTKYVALCEGDDYWIVPDKLQKQVDTLCDNKELGLCYTRSNYLYSDGCTSTEPIMENHDIMSLLRSNPIRTLTVMYKADIYNEFVHFSKDNNLPMFDYPMFLWFSYFSEIVYLRDITGVYRVLEESASHSRKDSQKILSFQEKCMSVRAFWLKYLNIDSDEYYYYHYLKCYKYAIVKKNVDSIDAYRLKIIESQYNKKSILSRLMRLLLRAKIDIFASYFIVVIKPFIKKILKIVKR